MEDTREHLTTTPGPETLEVSGSPPGPSPEAAPSEDPAGGECSSGGSAWVPGALAAVAGLVPPALFLSGISAPFAVGAALGLVGLAVFSSRRSIAKAEASRLAKERAIADALERLQTLEPVPLEGEGQLPEAFTRATCALAAARESAVAEREQTLRREAAEELDRVRTKCESLVEGYLETLHKEKKEAQSALEAERLSSDRERRQLEVSHHLAEDRAFAAEDKARALEDRLGLLERTLEGSSEQSRRASEEADRLAEEVNRLRTRSLRFFDKVAARMSSPIQIASGLAGDIILSLSAHTRPEAPQREAGAAKGEGMPDPADAALEIQRRMAYLDRLVQSVLDLSRLEASALTVVFSEVDLPKLVRSVVAEYAEGAKAKEIALLAEVSSKLPPVQTDARLFRKALRELLHNAVEYTQRGGRVVAAVSVEEPASAELPDTLSLHVRDTGPGIPPEDSVRIFEAFERGGDPRFILSESKAGLGLTLAKGYANMLGGSLALQSEPGRGSEFVFSIPVKVCSRLPY